MFFSGRMPLRYDFGDELGLTQIVSKPLSSGSRPRYCLFLSDRGSQNVRSYHHGLPCLAYCQVIEDTVLAVLTNVLLLITCGVDCDAQLIQSPAGREILIGNVEALLKPVPSRMLLVKKVKKCTFHFRHRHHQIPRGRVPNGGSGFGRNQLLNKQLLRVRITRCNSRADFPS